ncbi:MAG: hypothetical protein PHG96_11220 [Kiritimatiellae bacterium]|nr:hypothetical protein [Kiritimatiellia bacterium]
MNNSIMKSLLTAAFFLAVLHSQAENTFVVTNKIGNTECTFTNTAGTASVEEGMIVFEGELVADMAVSAALTGGKWLASVQVVVQIKLFEELPGSEDVGAGVQGAVMALNDDPGDPGVTTGTFYAYGAGGWVQLTNSYSHLPYTTYENKTNIVTMIFDYTAAPAITYYVDIGNPEPANQVSQEITSPVTDESGINSISLSGSGALEVDGLSATGGSTAPLSLGMSLSVYYAGTGVWARVSTVSEEGHDPIRIYADINGDGKFDENEMVGIIYNTHGDGFDHVYTVPLGGLVPGESYFFSILDDEGHTFVMSEPVLVKVIQVGETAVETVMEMKMLSVLFNSEPGRRYQVKISESLDSAASWTVADVYIDGGFTNEFAAAGEQTQIRIPINKTKAFFRIFMLED